MAKQLVLAWCILVFLFGAVGECTGTCDSPIVEAQPRERPEPVVPPHAFEVAEHVWLARLALHEEGWHTDGVTAIYQTLRNRGRNWTLLQSIAAGRRTHLIFDINRQGRSGWKHRVMPDCEHAPEGFRNPHTWDRRWQPKCERLMEHARRLVEGTVRRSICRGNPTSWGGNCDTPTGACDRPPLGACAVPCPGTNNLYYRRGEAHPLTLLCI